MGVIFQFVKAKLYLPDFLRQLLFSPEEDDSLETSATIRTLGDVFKSGYGFWADREVSFMPFSNVN
jgi:hypothetical protein